MNWLHTTRLTSRTLSEASRLRRNKAKSCRRRNWLPSFMRWAHLLRRCSSLPRPVTSTLSSPPPFQFLRRSKKLNLRYASMPHLFFHCECELGEELGGFPASNHPNRSHLTPSSIFFPFHPRSHHITFPPLYFSSQRRHRHQEKHQRRCLGSKVQGQGIYLLHPERACTTANGYCCFRNFL